MRALCLFLLGVLFIEATGYAYHRWFEHGEILRLLDIRRWVKQIVKEHRVHHSRHYPPQALRREVPYITGERLTWYLPGAAITAVVFAVAAWRTAIPFAAGGWVYGISLAWLHAQFHVTEHFLVRNRCFLWLRRVHDVHHIDETKNFTIMFPIIDMLLGTYAPAPAEGARADAPALSESA
jgi:sterol desaturase/sphingolipid hydroxylase (fatty acid hydroxylase superfamily)